MCVCFPWRAISLLQACIFLCLKGRCWSQITQRLLQLHTAVVGVLIESLTWTHARCSLLGWLTKQDSTTTTSCRVCLIEQTGFSVCNASKIQTQRLTLVISPWLRCSGMHLTQGSQSMLQRPGCGNTVPELCQDSGQGHILIRASREGLGVLLPGPQDEKTLPFLGSFFFKTRIISLNPFFKNLAIKRLNTILET